MLQQRKGGFDAHLEPVELHRGAVLYESLLPRTHVYFPAGSVVSLVYETLDGDTCEIAVVGDEGMLGISLIMGSGISPMRAVVQAGGHAWRMDGDAIRRQFRSDDDVQRLLLHYAQALRIETAQTAVCNRHHSVEQQLCRWLLMMLDRVPGPELALTHEMMARMIGVRREGVTEAAGKLQRAGAIHCTRGRIELIDRAKLEALACECYGVVRREFVRLLPPPRELQGPPLAAPSCAAHLRRALRHRFSRMHTDR